MIYWDYSPISGVLTTWNGKRLQFPAQSRLCSFSRWAGASGRQVGRWGTGLCNSSPRHEKALCLCPQPAGRDRGQQACPLCAHPRGTGYKYSGRPQMCPLPGQGLETWPELGPEKTGLWFLHFHPWLGAQRALGCGPGSQGWEGLGRSTMP